MKLNFPIEPAEKRGSSTPFKSKISATYLVRILIQKVMGMGVLFISCVVFPTFAAIIYFGLVASDVYVSESRFVVKSPDKSSTTALGILLKSTGFGNAGDELFAAQNYVVSRDALKALNRDGAIAQAYGNDRISLLDRFNPVGASDTFEDLYKYYERMVSVEHDTSSSITTLTVRAFTPKDAYRFNRGLLEQSEALVNHLNERGREDLVRYAEAEVAEAKNKARAAALALSAYRNREGVVDPEKQAAVQLQMIAKLQDDLIASKTQLRQLRLVAPENPQIAVLETRVSGLNQEIAEQLDNVAGGRKSLSAAAAQYQRLQLESQFSDRQLASAMASLQEARNEARRKQAYVERIVQPNIPDYPLEPRRLRGILATLVLGLIAWGILTMLLAGIKEHRD